MSRLSRKNRTEEELGIKSRGGMFDLFDNEVKNVLRITDEEYDHLADKIADDEINFVFKDNLTFSEKRRCLIIVDKHLKDFYGTKTNN